jgi:hypothetical protein
MVIVNDERGKAEPMQKLLSSSSDGIVRLFKIINNSNSNI